MMWVSVKVSPGRILVLLGCQVAGFLSLLPPVRAKCARTIYRSIYYGGHSPQAKVRGVLPAQRPIFEKLVFDANLNHNAFPAPSP